MDLGDDPSPPSREEIDLDAEIAMVCGFLNRSRNDEVPNQIVPALGILCAHGRGQYGLRPSAERRDELLKAVTQARFGVMKFVEDAGYDMAEAQRGMDALMGLIHLWGESDTERAARHPHTAPDLLANAGIFRNTMRSAQLRLDIESRAHQRRADMVTLFSENVA